MSDIIYRLHFPALIIAILNIFWWQVIEDMEHAIQMGLRAEEIVYTFQLPHPR